MTAPLAQTLAALADDPHDAWAYVESAPPAQSNDDAPLAGVPFGVKDIIDVRGMPTGFGRDDRAPVVAHADAWCVAALRAAGAVPVGKTRSTPHAFTDPSPTRNARHPGRTPGGSSAGSGAAVGAAQVPFALATQTLGSTLRPAAYAGVAGFKPSFGRIPMQGIAALAPSLDTLGIIAADVSWLRRAAAVLLPDSQGASPRFRLGLAPDALADRFAPATLAAIGALGPTLEAAGFTVERVTVPPPLLALDDALAIVAYEAAAVVPVDDALPPKIGELVARGRTIDIASYRAAMQRRARVRAIADEFFAAFDAVVVPLADPPPTPETTGDGIPLAPWTFLGLPSLGIPVAEVDGFPISAQFVARAQGDGDVLAVAAAVEGAVRAPVR